MGRQGQNRDSVVYCVPLGMDSRMYYRETGDECRLNYVNTRQV